MDWKKPENYEFADADSRDRWAWEFLRRNAEYRADFESAQSGAGPLYFPPKEVGETDESWVSRVVREGIEPKKVNAMNGLARRWLLKILQDPSESTAPKFLEPYPFFPAWSELDELYAREEERAPIEQRSGVAVIAFNLGMPLGRQLANAKAQLAELSQKPATKPKNMKAGMWPLYLRILDAEDAGADVQEIIASISEYSVLPNDGASGYLAADRVSDNKAQAKKLLSNPLSILR